MKEAQTNGGTRMRITVKGGGGELGKLEPTRYGLVPHCSNLFPGFRLLELPTRETRPIRNDWARLDSWVFSKSQKLGFRLLEESQ